jgi:hypothetical protein
VIAGIEELGAGLGAGLTRWITSATTAPPAHAAMTGTITRRQGLSGKRLLGRLARVER